MIRRGAGRRRAQDEGRSPTDGFSCLFAAIHRSKYAHPFAPYRLPGRRFLGLLLSLWATAPANAAIQIPRQSEWTYRGVAVTAGPPGSWDTRFDGQISPASVVKRDGTYFLYYVGADGDRSTDGGPRHRALGVATSTDGLRFTKHPTNPVITHLPHMNQEEGVFSAGATLDGEGNVHLYYGAIWAANATTEAVRGHVALATSSDGLHFTDRGYVVSWDDDRVWGHGDELFPLGALLSGGECYLYYGAKGGGAMWDLGLASGERPDRLSDTRAVLTGGSDIIGGCDPILLDEETIALFVVRDFDQNVIEARTASLDQPARLSEPVETYDMFPPRYRHTTVFLDRAAATWFMYQATDRENDGHQIIVRTAPLRSRMNRSRSGANWYTGIGLIGLALSLMIAAWLWQRSRVRGARSE